MKIKYSVKPQTVLTVQKENAFFAASMSTSVSVGHVAALVCSGFPVSLSPHPNQASLSRCANQRATEPETTTGQHHNLWLEVLLEVRAWWPCPERPRPCAGGGHHGPCWCVSREPQRASQSQEHQYNFPKKVSSLESHLPRVMRARSALRSTCELHTTGLYPGGHFSIQLKIEFPLPLKKTRGWC